MYIVQKCGHKTNIDADIVKLEVDLRDLTKIGRTQSASGVGGGLG